MKDINIIDPEVLKELDKLRNNGLTKQSRIRSHAILLLNNGKSKKEIAEIFDVTNRTVYNWIKEWKKRDIGSMHRKKGDGRKPLLTAELHKKIIKKHIDNYPHQPKKAYALTLKEIKIEVSYETFKRFLKKYLN